MSDYRPWYACTGDPCTCPKSPTGQTLAALDYAEQVAAECHAVLVKIGDGCPDPRQVANDLLEAHGLPLGPRHATEVPAVGLRLRRTGRKMLAGVSRWAQRGRLFVTQVMTSL